MHKQFRELLDKATGKSEHIIALVIDIRGFTSFCQTADSLDTATYIKKVYTKIIDDYFPYAGFYKPTGDGLLVVVPYNSKTLKKTVNLTMKSCLDLLQKFGQLCRDDAMVNFPTPNKIGMGLTRGSACCIISDGKKLDYAGKVLNLASRLMEISRPSGITFDEGLGYDLLLRRVKRFFEKDKVYLRSVAEEKPLIVYVTRDYTLVSDMHKHPIKEPDWETLEFDVKFKTFKQAEPWFVVDLKRKPLDRNKLLSELTYPASEHGKRVRGLLGFSKYTLRDKEMEWDESGGNFQVGFLTKSISAALRSCGVTDNMVVHFCIKYPVR